MTSCSAHVNSLELVIHRKIGHGMKVCWNFGTLVLDCNGGVYNLIDTHTLWWFLSECDHPRLNLEENTKELEF